LVLLGEGFLRGKGDSSFFLKMRYSMEVWGNWIRTILGTGLGG